MVNPDDSDFRFAFPQPIQNPLKAPTRMAQLKRE